MQPLVIMLSAINAQKIGFAAQKTAVGITKQYGETSENKAQTDIELGQKIQIKNIEEARLSTLIKMSPMYSAELVKTREAAIAEREKYELSKSQATIDKITLDNIKLRI